MCFRGCCVREKFKFKFIQWILYRVCYRLNSDSLMERVKKWIMYFKGCCGIQIMEKCWKVGKLLVVIYILTSIIQY